MNTEAECRLIYKQAFKDEDDTFENLLFKYCYKHCRTLKEAGRVASMLFALPCEIAVENKSYSSIYIYAAATLEAARGRGYMSELIEKVKKEGNDIIFLRPAKSSLIEFYKKLGFIEIKTENLEKEIPFVTPKKGFEELLKDEDLTDSEDFTLMYYSSCGINLKKLHFINSME